MDVWAGSQGVLRAFRLLSHYVSVLSIYRFPFSLHPSLALWTHVSLCFLPPPNCCLSTVILYPVGDGPFMFQPQGSLVKGSLYSPNKNVAGLLRHL